MGRSQNSSQPKCWLFRNGEKETTWWRGEDLEVQPTFVTKNLGGEFKIPSYSRACPQDIGKTSREVQSVNRKTTSACMRIRR